MGEAGHKLSGPGMTWSARNGFPQNIQIHKNPFQFSLVPFSYHFKLAPLSHMLLLLQTSHRYTVPTHIFIYFNMPFNKIIHLINIEKHSIIKLSSQKHRMTATSEQTKSVSKLNKKNFVYRRRSTIRQAYTQRAMIKGNFIFVG